MKGHFYPELQIVKNESYGAIMKEKKMIAAISAVMTYIKTEEEMAAMQYANQVKPDEPETSSVSLNLWGISGRQVIMNMRSMVQMKSFHRSKLR